MDIRKASIDDLPAIVELFRVSLGDKGGVPSEEFWYWKHHSNPFGPSSTLLAWVDDRLVGLRTLLRWRFRYQGNTFSAFRAVDTATHPSFRGHGIFRKLTLRIIEEIATEEPAIIFNTPNSMSMPGYLKMGWKSLGKTPLMIRPFPTYLIYNRFAKSARRKTVQEWPASLADTWNEIQQGYFQVFHGNIATDVSLDYLKWRYKEIPGVEYNFHLVQRNGNHCLIFYRLKAGNLVELRITDVFFNQPVVTLVRQGVHEIVDLHRPDIVTILEDPNGILASLLPTGFVRLRNRGLMMTYRHVNDDTLTELVSDQKRWYVSAGAIELL